MSHSHNSWVPPIQPHVAPTQAQSLPTQPPALLTQSQMLPKKLQVQHTAGVQVQPMAQASQLHSKNAKGKIQQNLQSTQLLPKCHPPIQVQVLTVHPHGLPPLQQNLPQPVTLQHQQQQQHITFMQQGGPQRVTLQHQGLLQRVTQQQGIPKHLPQQQGLPQHVTQQGLPQHVTQQGLPQHVPQQQGLPQHVAQQQGLPQYVAQQQGLPQHVAQQQGLPQHVAQQGLLQHVAQQQGLPQHVTQQQGLPQHVAQQGLPQHVAQQQGLPQHVAQQGLPQHVPQQQGLPQHVPQQQGLPQHVTQQGLPQHVAQQQGLPQHVAQQQGLPQHVAQQQGLPQHVTQQQGLPQHVSQQQGLPQYVAQQQGLPQHVAQQQGLPQHSTQQGLSQHVTQQQGLPQLVTQQQGLPQHLALQQPMQQQHVALQQQGLPQHITLQQQGVSQNVTVHHPIKYQGLPQHVTLQQQHVTLQQQPSLQLHVPLKQLGPPNHVTLQQQGLPQHITLQQQGLQQHVTLQQHGLQQHLKLQQQGLPQHVTLQEQTVQQPMQQQLLRPSLVQINVFLSCANTLIDGNVKEDIKFRAALEIKTNIELIVSTPHYQLFLDHAMPIFLQVLQDDQYIFFGENPTQKVRLVILKIIHRLPKNDFLRPYVRQTLSLLLLILKRDNEENALQCIQIMIDLYRHYKPEYNAEVSVTMEVVQGVYARLPENAANMLRQATNTNNMDSQQRMEYLKSQTYYLAFMVQVPSEVPTLKRGGSNTTVPLTFLPKSLLSLKVLQELPMVVLQLWQCYKQFISNEMNNLIPLMITAINVHLDSQLIFQTSQNRDIFLEYLTAQVKMVSFLACVFRMFEGEISKQSDVFLRGSMQLFRICPNECTTLRKELLFALHTLVTATCSMRQYFLPFISHLCTEEFLLGRSLTSKQILRPMAFSTLANLLSSLKDRLSLEDTAAAMHLFANILLDVSLPYNSHLMACGLLIKFVDPMLNKLETSKGLSRELLMRTMHVFTLKLKSIVKFQLPLLVVVENPSNSNESNTNFSSSGIEPDFTEVPMMDTESVQSNVSGCIVPSIHIGEKNSYTLEECRRLIRAMVDGASTISSVCPTCTGTFTINMKAGDPWLLLQFFKWAVRSLTAFNVAPNETQDSCRLNVMKRLASLLYCVTPLARVSIYESIIHTLVSNMPANAHLLLVFKLLLTNATMFPKLLIGYLVSRRSELSGEQTTGAVTLELFKLVFESYDTCPGLDEIVRGHIQTIVTGCLDLAEHAKYPQMYYAVLSSMFRALNKGGGDYHAEFDPLMPGLLTRLHGQCCGSQKKNQNEVCIELALSIPASVERTLVSVSVLMDTVLLAFETSTDLLVALGLKTYELCLDNISRAFFLNETSSIHGPLSRSLWRLLRHPVSSISDTAFHVVGKLGSEGHRMLSRPQPLDYRKGLDGPELVTHLIGQVNPVFIPMRTMVERAVEMINSPNLNLYYEHHCWEVIRSYLIATLHFDDDETVMKRMFAHSSYSDPLSEIRPIRGQQYQMTNQAARDLHITALTGMFRAGSKNGVRKKALHVIVFIVNLYTMIAVAQQAGPWSIKGPQSQLQGLDVLVVIDAIAKVMCCDETEIIKPAILGLMLIQKSAASIVGTKEQVGRLPFTDYLATRLSGLCYEQQWCSKKGGCIMIKCMIENFDLRWSCVHLLQFVKALLFVLADVNDQPSNGTTDRAKTTLEKIITAASVAIEPDGDKYTVDTITAQRQALFDVTRELVCHLSHTVTLVRETVMHLLRLMSQQQGVSVASLLDSHRVSIPHIILPKKVIRSRMSMHAQVAILDITRFSSALSPRFFTLDPNLEHHNDYLEELLLLVDSSEPLLAMAAIQVVATFHYVVSARKRIVASLLNVLRCTRSAAKQVAFEALLSFKAGYELIDYSIAVRCESQVYVHHLATCDTLDVTVLQHVYYLVRLLPDLTESVAQLLVPHLVTSVNTHSCLKFTGSESGEVDECLRLIIEIFCCLPTVDLVQINIICRIYAKAMQLVQPSHPSGHSLLRVLLIKFFLRNPTATISHFLSEQNVKDEHMSSYLLYLLDHDDCQGLRDATSDRVERLCAMLTWVSDSDRLVIQYEAVRIVAVLIKHQPQWFSSDVALINKFKVIWYNDRFHKVHSNIGSVPQRHWNIPKLLCKIMLYFFIHNPGDMELLFQLLRAFNGRNTTDFKFLSKFLSHTVSHYSVSWKRVAFFTMVKMYGQVPRLPDALKANMLDLVIIPCFTVCFLDGTGGLLLGPPANNPELDDPANVVAIFINRLIDVKELTRSEEGLNVAMLRLCCLLLTHAPHHVHDETATQAQDARPKLQGNRLQKLVSYAWPCLDPKTFKHPAVRYQSHLLLAHIIIQLPMKQRMMAQVMHSLLRAHDVQVRSMVQETLVLLTPLMSQLDQGHHLLYQWVVKIVDNDGHLSTQLTHIMQTIVQNHQVYYHVVQYNLLQLLNKYVPLLGFSAAARPQLQELSLDLVHVMIKWEVRRVVKEPVDKEMNAWLKRGQLKQMGMRAPPATVIRLPHAAPEEPAPCRLMAAPPQFGGQFRPPLVGRPPVPVSPVKFSTVIVVNFLLRIAIKSVNLSRRADKPTTLALCRANTDRCVELLRPALDPKIRTDLARLKLDWLVAMLTASASDDAEKVVALRLVARLVELLPARTVNGMVLPLQNGIEECAKSQNSNVVSAVHLLLVKLANVNLLEVIHEDNAGITGKPPTFPEAESFHVYARQMLMDGLSCLEPSVLSARLKHTVFTLDTLTAHNHRLLDPYSGSLLHAMQYLWEKSSMEGNEKAAITELLLTCMNLVRHGFVGLGADLKQQYFATLSDVVNKCEDREMITAVIQMLDDWLKNSVDLSECPHVSSIYEVLLKLMDVADKQFSNDEKLHESYLDVIYWIFREKLVRPADCLTDVLEPAFVRGLRCNQPALRHKYAQLLDTMVKRRADKRLVFACTSNLWRGMGAHCWISQAIELVFNAVVNTNVVIQVRDEAHQMIAPVRYATSRCKLGQSNEDPNKSPPNDRKMKSELKQVLSGIESSIEVRATGFLKSVAQLCHLDQSLARAVWLDVFPVLWHILNTDQQTFVCNLRPFVLNVAPENRKSDAVGTLIEGLTMCPLPTDAYKEFVTVAVYLCKMYNLWHGVTLKLEELHAQLRGPLTPQDTLTCVKALAASYTAMQEHDTVAGILQNHSLLDDTNEAVACSQHGQYEHAVAAHSAAAAQFLSVTRSRPASNALLYEADRLDQLWVTCLRELNQWDCLVSVHATDPYQALEGAAQVGDWMKMKEALVLLGDNCSDEVQWKVSLYHGWLSVCYEGERDLKAAVGYATAAKQSCLERWRRLPRIASPMHLPMLQAAHLIVELEEAAFLYQNVSDVSVARQVFDTWSARKVLTSDNLSHWYTVLAWRQHVYNLANADQQQQQLNQQCLISVARAARKQHLPNLCIDMISPLDHSDAHVYLQTTREQVKCLLQFASHDNENIIEALSLLESADVTSLSHEQLATFFALKGDAYGRAGMEDDAQKCLSSATQLDGSCSEAWGLWGDYMATQATDVDNLVTVISCYFHACQPQSETNTRNYIAKVIWLLSYDDATGTLARETAKCDAVLLRHWLPWVPQLLRQYVGNKQGRFYRLLLRIANRFPQAAYFAVRTYLPCGKKSRPTDIVLQPAFVKTTAKLQESSVGDLKMDPGICTRIINKLMQVHPLLTNALENITNELLVIGEHVWYEEAITTLTQQLSEGLAAAFVSSETVQNTVVPPALLASVNQLVTVLGQRLESMSMRARIGVLIARQHHPELIRMKAQLRNEMTLSTPESRMLHNLIAMLRKWITVLEDMCMTLPNSSLIGERARYLHSFSLQTAEVSLPGASQLPTVGRPSDVLVSGFRPIVTVSRHSRAVIIRGSDGRDYRYEVVTHPRLADVAREEAVVQMLGLFNSCMDQQKATCRRMLHFELTCCVALSPATRLVQSRADALSLLDIHKQSCEVTPDTVTHFYSQLSEWQLNNPGAVLTHETRRQLYDVVHGTVPDSFLRSWACKSFPAAVDYWTFRKTLATQLAVWFVAEYALHLTRVDPSDLRVDPTTGLVYIQHAMHDVRVTKHSVLLDCTRQVPFRLTPRWSELLSDAYIDGDLKACMITTARCLDHRVTTVLRAIVLGQMDVPKEDLVDVDKIVNTANKWVDAIMARMTDMAAFQGNRGKVANLLDMARNADNLCHMDPVWMPWL